MWRRVTALDDLWVGEMRAANVDGKPLLLINVEGGVADMSQGNSDKDCANGQSPINSLDGVGTPAATAKKTAPVLPSISAPVGLRVPSGAMPMVVPRRRA